jgi:hypothetical protein
MYMVMVYLQHSHEAHSIFEFAWPGILFGLTMVISHSEVDEWTGDEC